MVNLPFNKQNSIKLIIFTLFVFSLAYPVSASTIKDFFSDFTSSDVTLLPDNSIRNGTVVFDLYFEGDLVESQEVPLNMNSEDPVSRVIIWQKRPQQDYFTARVKIYSEGVLLDESSYQVSYSTASLPGFHVVDFSPSNSGVKILIRPFNPSVADIKIELLEKNEIVYSEIKEDVSLTANTEVEFDWPFVLINDKKYTVRAKIFTHRLYAPVLINSYVANFTAKEDIEILQDDVEVDEFGASVTIEGKSQVAFDGFLKVMVRNRVTGEILTYSQQLDEILVLGREDTVGVVWGDIPPGVYDVEIMAVNTENVTRDKYETVIRIPEIPEVIETTPEESLPGFTAYVSIIILFAAARRMVRGRVSEDD